MQILGLTPDQRNQKLREWDPPNPQSDADV